MNYFLSRRAVLKHLETPYIYQIAKDELYELDADSFRFLKDCSEGEGCSSKDGAFIDYCMDEGLLTTERTNVVRPHLQQSPIPSLRYLELQITDACNLACKHCYLEKGARHELSPLQVQALLEEFQNMQGLRVLITGGEPLVHSRFSEINELLPGFFIRKVLFTNGLLLDKEAIKSLKVDEIQVSIDGLEDAHDHLRGRGAFKHALGAVKSALDAGFDVSVSTMVYRHNLGDFEQMERLFRDLGVKDWTVDIPVMTGRFKDHADLCVGFREGGKYLGYGYGGGLHSSGAGFGCGLHLLSASADGAIAKCTLYRDHALGSADDGLHRAWTKLRPVRLSELACKCEYLEVCRGGCRYRAETVAGKGGRDLYRCALYDIL